MIYRLGIFLVIVAWYLFIRHLLLFLAFDKEDNKSWRTFPFWWSTAFAVPMSFIIIVLFGLLGRSIFWIITGE